MNLNPDEIRKAEEAIKELFEKATFPLSGVAIHPLQDQDNLEVDLTLQEPKFFIGQNGQTLFEVQRILRMMLNKLLQKNFSVAVDINDYRKQKVEYLKKIARDAANEVVLTQQSKILSPMSSYERRIIHMELAARQDVKAESHGEGDDRHLIITPLW